MGMGYTLAAMMPEPLRGLDAVLRRVEPAYRAALGDLDGVADIRSSLLAVDTAQKIVAIDHLIRRLDPSFRLGPATRVLDVGVGRGRVLAMLKALGARRLWGIDDFGDPTYAAVSALGDVTALGIEAIRHDVTSTPWPLDDGVFDLVVSFNTLEHLPCSPKGVLGEVHRVLRPGGVFVLGLPNMVALYKRLYVVAGRTNLPRFDVWWDQNPWRGHVREAAPGELREMMRRSGFAVVTPEMGVDCEVRHRLGRAYPPYGALVALAPRQLADFLFCAGIKTNTH